MKSLHCPRFFSVLYILTFSMNDIKCMLVNSVYMISFIACQMESEKGMKNGKKEENTLILFQLHAHKDIMMN